MPAVRRQFRADRALPRAAPVRLAEGDETPVSSPVHEMQRALESAPPAAPETAFEEDLELYPLWFRRSFPIVASGLLWALIALVFWR